MDALIISDPLCLSYQRLVKELEYLQKHNDDFRFRWATRVEAERVLRQTGVKVLPLILIGNQYLSGFPAPGELKQWVSHLQKIQK